MIRANHYTITLIFIAFYSVSAFGQSKPPALPASNVPGKDNFIEYQDARDFLVAAYELLSVGSVINLTPDGRAAFDKLRNEVFVSLDPPDPNRPVPASEVKALIERAERGLGS